MGDIDKIVEKYSSDPSLDKISKFVLNEKDVKNETLPNAMTIGGLPEIGLKRLKPAAIPKWLLSHPAVERGIEFKFNRMIRQLDKNDIANNIIPKDNSKEATDARDYCVEILKNSSNQPVTWIKQFGRDAMRFGDNYLLLVTNRKRDKVLRWELQHPIFFSPMYDKMGGSQTVDINPMFNFALRGQDNIKYRIDPKTKKPSEYTQLKKMSTTVGLPSTTINPENINFIPVGKIFPAKRVVQLNFDRMGDDPFGIPIAQTLWTTVKQIIRVEDAGAETMVAFGYNRWIANTSFRTKEKMQSFGRSIENIAKRSVIILPEGIKLENVKPGSTEFDKVHDILLSLIAMRLGISIVQLKGEGADINKSCYDEFTQTLTENGWKYYWEIDDNERIAQFDPSTGEVEFVKHNGLYVYEYEGKMWHYKNKLIDICVTPDHRMYYSPSTYDNWQIKKGDQIKKTTIKNGIKFKNTCDGFKGKEDKYKVLEEGRDKIIMEMDDYLELVGYYLSEGGMSTYPITIGKEKIYNITFAQNFGEKFDKMDKLFTRLSEKHGIKYTKYKNKKFNAWHWNLHKKLIWIDLYKNYGEYSHTKRIPSWIFELSRRQLKILYEAMMLGDGHSHKGKDRYYGSCSSKLIDDFQTLAFLVGKRSCMNIRQDDRKKEYKTFYRTSLCDRKTTIITDDQIKKFNYKGKVWCFSVPKTLFVTRRAGKIAIQGNTLGVMMKDIRSDFFADELELEAAVNDGFIKSCVLKYDLRTTEQLKNFPFPRFIFSEIEEDEETRSALMLKDSLSLRNTAYAVELLSNQGYVNEAKQLLDNYLATILPKKVTQETFKKDTINSGAIETNVPVSISPEKTITDAPLEKDEKNSQKKE